MMNEEHEYLNEEQLEKARRIAYLVTAYINKKLTVEEHDELDAWVIENDDNMKLFEDLTDENNIEETKQWIAKLDTKKALEKFKKRTMERRPALSTPLKRTLVFLAAASLLWITLIIFKPHPKNDQPMTDAIANKKNDLPPGGNKAVLILNDGSKINLDSLNDGKIATEQNAVINKLGAALDYSVSDPEKHAETGYNTLATPRGGQYHLTLSDGTQVWLNAASSIRYPTVFFGGGRKVEITGEAYFEVAKNPAMPFTVSTGKITVEVMGTHFNVNAYADEETVTTTLLEGSIKLNSNLKNILLKPAQQAEVLTDGQIKMTDNINGDEAIAWKNGFFFFHDEPIDKLMRQAARWYDADIKYEGNVPDHFNADIKRDVPISKLLHLLELTGRVHFQIDGKTITVKP